MVHIWRIQNFTPRRVDGQKKWYFETGQNVPKNEQTTKKAAKGQEIY